MLPDPSHPIILCTGYRTLICEETVKAHGIREFVMKPLAKKDLATPIWKVLNPALPRPFFALATPLTLTYRQLYGRGLPNRINHNQLRYSFQLSRRGPAPENSWKYFQYSYETFQDRVAVSPKKVQVLLL